MESAKNGTKLARGANFKCLMSGAPIAGDFIKAEGKAGRMGARLMAIVAEGERGRLYLAPTTEHEVAAHKAKPTWKPEGAFVEDARAFTPCIYGITEWQHLFTNRQIVALTTFSDLVQEAREWVKLNGLTAGMPDDGKPLRDGGTGANAYAEAVGVYLALAVDRMANTLCTIARWTPNRQQTVTAFARQAIPMTWDFPDVNPFANAAGDYGVSIDGVIKGISSTTEPPGFAQQADATTQDISRYKLVSTDPPYYDNVPYADLSDFFYVWLRRSLRAIFPELFATLAVPKTEELVAFAYRHQNGKVGAENFFLDGMTKAMQRLAVQAHPAFPVTIYYAFKQSETYNDFGTASTGWETFLDAAIMAGLAVSGTWPMRTELGNRVRGMESNALASSIVLVCRQRDPDASPISRREFQRELREHMPDALETMIGGKEGASPIAPVDLAQAAIGPGMAIFSRHAAVLEADGSPMGVHNALILINKEIDAFLNPEGGGFDNDTLFCAAWFDQYGWSAGKFGEADTLSRAKGTSVDGVSAAGVVESGGGKVRLLKWEEYPVDWNPEKDTRMPAWEAAHHLIRTLNTQSYSAAGALLAHMPERAEHIRQLAYHLYTLCERKKWAEPARAYNELITSWHAIVAASHEAGRRGAQAEFEL